MTIARSESSRGEIALRRREVGAASVHELIVNGAFAMDSLDTATERALARIALEETDRSERVLVGGLGLGFTAAEALSHPVDRVDVVEIEAALVAWARAGVTATLADVAEDPRVRLHRADLHDVITGSQRPPTGPWDVILLDVDNGPDFLIHPPNDRLYEPDVLSDAYERLRPGGLLAIWCQGPVPSLLTSLRGLVATRGQVVEELFTVQREGRNLTYAIYLVRRERQ